MFNLNNNGRSKPLTSNKPITTSAYTYYIQKILTIAFIKKKIIIKIPIDS